MSTSNISNGTSSWPSFYQNANPLLYTQKDNEQMGIEPYWMLLLHFIAFEVSQRFWNKATYNTWYLALEDGCPPDPVEPPPKAGMTVMVVQDFCKKSKKSEPKRQRFDFSDFNRSVNFIIAISHFFSYQPACMSDSYGTTWRCYNALGYRLYNYQFTTWAFIVWTSYIKFKVAVENQRGQVKAKDKLPWWKRILTLIILFWEQLEVHAGSILSLAACVCGFVVMIPFMITNLIPMAFVYCFVCMIYGGALVIILIIARILEIILFGLRLLWKSPKKPIVVSHFKFSYTTRYVLAELTLYLIPTLMNYSQYLYFGEDFLQTITNEFYLREDTGYLQRLVNDQKQQLHTILNF